MKKSADAERVDFLGWGGLFGLFLKPDPRELQKLLALPRVMRTHPAYREGMDAEFAMAQSFHDPFLNKSKELFGGPFEEEPSFDGLPFILPLLTSQSVLAATPNERARWFELFDAYWIESKADKGLLLIVKDSHFDNSLQELLEGMRDAGHLYRSLA